MQLHRFCAPMIVSLFLMSSVGAQAQKASTAARGEKPQCMVAEIRGIAFSIHHPSERYQAVSEWLRKNGPHCSLEKLQYINSNRPNWFGHADSPALGQLMDQFIEVSTGSAPKNPATPTGERSSVMASAGGADAPKPVVPPPGAMLAPAVVAAPVNLPAGGPPKAPGNAAPQNPPGAAKP